MGDGKSTMRDLSYLSELERECLEKIVKCFFGQNLSTATFDVISESFYSLSPVFFSLISNSYSRPIKTSDFPMPLLRITLQSLIDHGLLSQRRDGDRERFEIHSSFAKEAQEIYQNRSNESDSTKKEEVAIPASDRFVSINHNSEEFSEAKTALEELESRVNASNEFTASADERLAVVREIKGLRDLLDEKFIRVAAIVSATKNSGVLAWLSSHVADGAIKTLAENAVKYLLKLIGFG